MINTETPLANQILHAMEKNGVEQAEYVRSLIAE